MTDAKGLHGLSCKGGTSQSARYHSPNDPVWHALGKVNIPSVKEPSGLSSSDGKRPDGRPDIDVMEKSQVRDVGRHRH